MRVTPTAGRTVRCLHKRRSREEWAPHGRDARTSHLACRLPPHRLQLRRLPPRWLVDAPGRAGRQSGKAATTCLHAPPIQPPHTAPRPPFFPPTGLDFSYVRHPFQPGSGKKKMSDFVRRRRWLRTRVPLELAAPRITAIAADTTSWSVAEEAAARGAAAGAAEEAAVAAAVATAAVAAEVGVTAPGEAPLMAGLAAAAAAAAAAAEDKPAAAGGVEEPVEAGKGGAPPTAAAPVQQAAAAATGAAKRAAASVATPLGAAAAAPPASLDPGQQGGEHGEVAAVLESIFARVSVSSRWLLAGVCYSAHRPTPAAGLLRCQARPQPW